MVSEVVTLKFKDGFVFIWDTGSIKDGKKALNAQRKHGDPVEIVGDGKVAKTLREKYAVYNADPEHYKSDVFGTASQLSGAAKDKLEADFKKASNELKSKLRFKLFKR